MFTVSKELREKYGSDIDAENPVKCFKTVIAHKTKTYRSLLFSTADAAKRCLEDFARENSRVKAGLGVVEGELKGYLFISDRYDEGMIRGEKQGKNVIWR